MAPDIGPHIWFISSVPVAGRPILFLKKSLHDLYYYENDKVISYIDRL